MLAIRECDDDGRRKEIYSRLSIDAHSISSPVRVKLLTALFRRSYIWICQHNLFGSFSNPYPGIIGEWVLERQLGLIDPNLLFCLILTFFLIPPY